MKYKIWLYGAVLSLGPLISNSFGDDAASSDPPLAPPAAATAEDLRPSAAEISAPAEDSQPTAPENSTPAAALETAAPENPTPALPSAEADRAHRLKKVFEKAPSAKAAKAKPRHAANMAVTAPTSVRCCKAKAHGHNCHRHKTLPLGRRLFGRHRCCT